MRKIILAFVWMVVITAHAGAKDNFFAADHPYFQYTGRIDFSDAKSPRLWTAGAYIQAKFEGSFCQITVEDQMPWDIAHNYLEVSIDGNEPLRLKLDTLHNVVTLPMLKKGVHTLIITKGTEAIMGYVVFKGLTCQKLLPLPAKPVLKIEFFGDSITSGMGSFTSVFPCGTGTWYDQHSAWYSYAAITARNLNAEYHLTSESGIGLIHSCCDKPYTMPRVFDKMDLTHDTIAWDFKRFQPDVVVINLGQNDGIQDSVQFTTAYIDFIHNLRAAYPKTKIACITSPMADDALRTALRNYLQGIKNHFASAGKPVPDTFVFEQQYIKGCGSHPDVNDHQAIARLLTPFLKTVVDKK